MEVDGPTIVVSLKGLHKYIHILIDKASFSLYVGRFWHATDTVMLRVESFIRQRLPEVIEVRLDTALSQIVDDNRLNSSGGPKKLF